MLACRRFLNLASVSALFALMGCSAPAPADSDWPVPGRTSDETHFSPLSQINDGSVKDLRLAWYVDFDIPWSASAPVQANGILYSAVGLSIVHAIDVKSGELLWTYDPKVYETENKIRLQSPQWGIRGLAYADGRLHVGTLDGRLIALNAETGTLLWETMTLKADAVSDYVTGAPRVFDGKVLTGFGGADIGVTRGYVTAYDAATGAQLWRFYTVPGNPASGFENAAMEMAANTWTGEWWRFGGGGTVWSAMTFDSEFNRVYLGTGNGLPWNRKIRSPDGGDNLFLSSIVALDADTGEYVWHYQTTPGETWDYNSSMDIQLTELRFDGEDIPVILHAPKNGFFYVIDRRDGQLISAEAFSKVTWAESVDVETGRPVEAAGARYENGPQTLYPGPAGARNWLPMSTNPETGLTYIPELTQPGFYKDVSDLEDFQPQSGINSSTGLDLSGGFTGTDDITISGSLLAWDPEKGRAAWQVAQPAPYGGGVISTAGNLVFQGRLDGTFVAYSADTGETIWQFDAEGPLLTPPITYAHDGIQYVTIQTGIPGFASVNGSLIVENGWHYWTYPRRILTFALKGVAELPGRAPPSPVTAFDDPSYLPNPVAASRGKHLYMTLSCAACHGPAVIAGAAAPDLRASQIAANEEAFNEVVQKGALASRGMPMFNDQSEEDLASLREYVRARAEDLRQEQSVSAN